MSTKVTYNGVTIRNCLTRQFEQVPIYDDSGADVIYHRVTMTVVGYIHLHELPADTDKIGIRFAAFGTADDTPGRETSIRRALLHARGELVVLIDDKQLLHVRPKLDPSSIRQYDDVNNGPKPQHCNITKIVGSALLEVSFSIEAAIVDCNTLTNSNNVLSNRWSMADDYDHDWYCTRTIDGTLRVATTALNVHAANFRALVFPPLQPGFRRDSIHIVSSPDQLTMRYRIVDRQLFASPPAPATTWSAQHTFATANGQTTTSELSISMRGPPNASKIKMIEACMLIATARLFKPENKHTFLRNASITDFLHDNSIQASFLFQHAPTKPIALFAVEDIKLGQPYTGNDLPDYNRFQHPRPAYFGQATPVGLFVSYLQTPCNSNHAVPNITADYPTEGETPQGGGTVVETSLGNMNIDPEIVGNYSEEHRQSMYTFYQIDSKYETDELIVQLPIAAASNSESQDTAAFIGLGRGLTKRIVRLAAERLGAWPDIPQPISATHNGLTMRLLKHWSQPKAPKFQADGKTQLFSIDAEYVYGMNRKPRVDEALVVGALPWDTTDLARNSLPASVYTPGIA